MPRWLRERVRNWIARSQFLKTTTIHPLGRLDERGSLKSNMFWVGISLLALSFSVYQISRDVQKMTASKYAVQVRFVERHEIVHPVFTLCLNHWALWVNFSHAYDKLNLTKLELVTLLAPFNSEIYLETCPEPATIRSVMQSALGKLGLPSEAKGEPISLEAIFLVLNNGTVINWPLGQTGQFHFRTSRHLAHLAVCVSDPVNWIDPDNQEFNGLSLMVKV